MKQVTGYPKLSLKFVSEFDLSKRYYQIPLTKDAKKIYAFASSDGLYQYKVASFGIQNASATFQRLINGVSKADKVQRLTSTSLSAVQ